MNDIIKEKIQLLEDAIYNYCDEFYFEPWIKETIETWQTAKEILKDASWN